MTQKLTPKDWVWITILPSHVNATFELVLAVIKHPGNNDIEWRHAMYHLGDYCLDAPELMPAGGMRCWDLPFDNDHGEEEVEHLMEQIHFERGA